MVRLGEHYLVELARCDSRVLSDSDSVENILLRACKEANAHRVDHNFYSMPDKSVSGVIVIEESHLSIHTFPEQEYAVADFFTCSDAVNEEKGIAYLAEKLGSGNYGFSRLERGLLPYHEIKIPKEAKAGPEVADAPTALSHVILDAWGINPAKLGKKEKIEKPFLEAVRSSGQTILYHNFHDFPVNGASGFVLGDKFHATVHDWPEHGYTAIDIMAREGKVDANKIVSSLLSQLQPRYNIKTSLERGSLYSPGYNTHINAW
ncbi:adenosylmethionine decarboxylase [Candidatus Woesearchaeota archaeon]|nr:adenosylmethionine decarboxylase [Candidatus Woesearchaeota archaeon]